MEIIKCSMFTDEMLVVERHVPLFICTNATRVHNRVMNAGYQEVQINERLSKQLMDIPKDERPRLVEQALKDILNYQVSIIITRFEMLFDPHYEIDVIKLFCDRARITNIAVKWPGKFIKGKLTYAEPGDPDYHEYDCNAYQIRIVQ